jgi:ring-1,2-phenylacetyl-CoA epoxidase subunit PaaC
MSPAVDARGLLRELLLELADDDFVVSIRASEWLGVAPHFEEDVAFSSIAQDEMGHAATYFGLLADLGSEVRDSLAHLRPPSERRNSVLVERVNGSGTYRDTPHFDWAYAICRHYLYDAFEGLRLDRVAGSRYLPLAEAAAKIRREERYHLLHHDVWLEQIAGSGDDGLRRLQRAFERAFADAGDLAYVEPWSDGWTATGFFPDSDTLHEEWLRSVSTRLKTLGIQVPVLSSSRNGRLGEHTSDLERLLEDVSEVYRQDPVTSW